jgi:hypothetical protein
MAVSASGASTHPISTAGVPLMREIAQVSDAADGADGIFERRPHPDDPVSGAALPTKGNCDAHGRKNVCARRSRPASPRGFMGQPGQPTATSSRLRLALVRIRSGCSIAERKTASFDSYRSLTATGLTLGYFASYFRRGPEHSRERNVK